MVKKVVRALIVEGILTIVWAANLSAQGPVIEAFDRLPDSYLITERVVTTHVLDYPIGVAWVKLHYKVNSQSTDTLDMILISGDSLDGVYSAAIPGVSSYDTVDYFIATANYSDETSTSPSHTYIIREGTPDNFLLLLEDDEYYGTPYSHDPVSSVVSDVDVWDESLYGRADSSVLYYYHFSGPGEEVILWFTWSGYHFAQETDFLADFLSTGGRLFVSSQDLAGGGFGLGYGHYTVPQGHFLSEYMKVEEGEETDPWASDSFFVQYGVPGDPLAGAANLAEIYVWPYDWAGSGNTWAGRFDELDPAAVPIFYGGVGGVNGYRYADPSGYKVVFLCYPWHYVIWYPPYHPGYDTEAQDTLIARTLDWFTYGCGDCNGDDRVTIADATYLVSYIYREGPVPLGEADVNMDDKVTIADATYLVAYIYRGGTPPCEPL